MRSFYTSVILDVLQNKLSLSHLVPSGSLSPYGGLIGYDLILPYFLNQYFVLQDFFSLYLIAAGFPDMGYLYPGFLYLNKTYLTRPHTVGPCP